MEEIISKEELEKLEKIEGETRGFSIKGEAEYILEKEGKEGLKKLEDIMEKIGYPIKYKELKTLNFYPVRYESITSLVLEKAFGFDKEEFQKLGRFESKLPLLIRVFTKYFTSIEKAAKAAPKMWRHYYTGGDVTVAELNKKERYVVLKLENFYTYPMFCQTLAGVFAGIVQIVVGKEVSCQETKCIHRGDEYHEFLLKW